MEVYIDIIILLALLYSISMNFLMCKRLDLTALEEKNFRERLSHDLGCIGEDIDRMEVKIANINHKMDLLPDAVKDRILLSLSENLESTKPMKPNNWDSFREAFKGPTRIEINERN